MLQRQKHVWSGESQHSVRLSTFVYVYVSVCGVYRQHRSYREMKKKDDEESGRAHERHWEKMSVVQSLFSANLTKEDGTEGENINGSYTISCHINWEKTSQPF